MSTDQEIIRNNIRHDTRLGEEELEERDSIIIPLGAVHSGNDGVAGEDGGTNAGEDGMASDGGGVVEVAGADEGLDAIVEVEAGAGQRGGGVREPGVGWGPRGGGVTAESVERGLDSEAALAAAPLCRGFLGGGEGEGPELEGREKRRGLKGLGGDRGGQR